MNIQLKIARDINNDSRWRNNLPAKAD